MDNLRTPRPDQVYAVLTTLALSEPKVLPQGKVYGLLRIERVFSSETDAVAHQKTLAEAFPKETFLVGKLGNYLPFTSNPIKFSFDTTTLTGSTLREGGFISDSEAQKTLRMQDEMKIRELKDTYENLKQEDENTETEGTVENYIKKRVVTTVLFDTVRSLKDKIEEAESKLTKAITNLLATENEDLVSKWLEVYNKKRKATGHSEYKDGLAFIEWLNSQRELADSQIRE